MPIEESPTPEERIHMLQEARRALTDIRGEKDNAALAKLCEFKRANETAVARLEMPFPDELKLKRTGIWGALETMSRGTDACIDMMLVRRYVQLLLFHTKNELENEADIRYSRVQ